MPDFEWKIDEVVQEPERTVLRISRRERIRTFVETLIVGHASPRWRQPGDVSEHERNLALSRQRAATVRRYYEEALRQELLPDADALSVTIHDAAIEAEGSQDTLVEAGGSEDVDETSMRRVEIQTCVTHQFEEYRPQKTPPREIQKVSSEWEIRIPGTLAAGPVVGPGGGLAMGFIRNMVSGEEAAGSFQGYGLVAGKGLDKLPPRPGLDPELEPVRFRTNAAYALSAFDGTLARLTTFGFGIGAIGYARAWISFPLLGAHSVLLQSISMGPIGVELGSFVGTWNLSDARPSDTQAIPEQIKGQFGMRYDSESFSHSTHFDTASARIANDELEELRAHIESVAAFIRQPYRLT